MISDPELVRELLRTAPMPPVPAAHGPGIAWLRAHVPRFCDGADHRRRRAAIQRELDRLDPAALRAGAGNRAGQPLAHVRVLLDAMGLPESAAEVVAVVAAAYQPHEPVDAAADTAVVELVALCRAAVHTDAICSERDTDTDTDRIVAQICILVQACSATGELIAAARASDTGAPADRPATIMATTPPLRSTRRVVDGTVVELDLRHPGLGFGAGPHRCPGSAHALAIATGVVESEATRLRVS
ncbi:hypothetical protein ACFVAV_29290 [Nocardia sp. NPDC057663]|uniref:hypothetical protein n=1 Tax=Nocardia sp. NPDC057663 TaxID=3346201 RepID=UPI00367006BA